MVKDQLLACAIASFMRTWSEHTVSLSVFVAENGLRSDLRMYNLKNFHGRCMPQVPQQMHVTHALSVPMLCPRNSFILATPLPVTLPNMVVSCSQTCWLSFKCGRKLCKALPNQFISSPRKLDISGWDRKQRLSIMISFYESSGRHPLDVLA